jgi:hypothetical protein
MASRVLRDEILSSDSLSQVSTDAELVFIRLILIVDDFGRADARVKLLRARLFPMRPAFTEQKISRCLCELSECEDPPIVFYEVDGHPYLYLPGWEKHRGKTKRAKNSRLPDPIQGIPGDPGDSGRSEDVHVGGGGGVGGGGEPAAPMATAPSARTHKSATSCPRALEENQRARVRSWAAKQLPDLGSKALGDAWEIFYAWAEAGDHKRKDWEAAFRLALGKGWVLTNGAPPGESPAEGRQRRTRENAQKAFEIGRQRDAEKESESARIRASQASDSVELGSGDSGGGSLVGAD